MTLEYICTNCLEEVHLAEVESGYSPCCDAKYTDDALRLRADATAFYQKFIIDLQDSDVEQKKVLAHIHSLPSDSKKRRKLYDKPTGKAAWPGQIGASYKKARKPRKRTPPLKSQNSEIDITLETRELGHVVNIYGKFENIIHEENKDKAKRKARSWLRARDSSITEATTVEEGDGVTNIYFGD